MTLYAESSAVLSWLLGESPGEQMRCRLAEASEVFASELTLLECNRVIHRAIKIDDLSPEDAETALARLEAGSASWHVFQIGTPVLNRARHQFPCEPVRTLDALHLATALRVREVRSGLCICSLWTGASGTMPLRWGLTWFLPNQQARHRD